MQKRAPYAKKRDWVISYLKRLRYNRLCLGEGEAEEAYADEFGVKLQIYTVGPSTCRDLARTLRRMWLDGLVDRYTGGNQDATYNCQKTYYVSYKLRPLRLTR